MVEHYPPVTETEHYLETTSKTNSGMAHISGLLFTVNDSLFCANVRINDGELFVAEYPARMLIVHTIWGEQGKDGRWQHRIRLAARPAPYLSGLNRYGENLQYQIYPEANFQHIFRSSLVWTVGYFRTAKGVLEMRFAPKNKEQKGQEDGRGK